MNIRITLLLALCIFPQLALHAENDITATNTVLQETDNRINIRIVKSIEDLDALTQNNKVVFACIFNASLITHEVVMSMLHELLALDNRIVYACINSDDIPNIKEIFPFTTAATLISFVEGQPVDQLNID
jgi:hypothetical protein